MHHSVLKLVLSALSVAAIPAAAPAATMPAPEINVSADGLAIRGYDATAYYLRGQPMLGSVTYQLHYKGATWRFASSKALARFKANPIAYAPQFGGYCSWAVSQAYIAPGDPTQWKIVDGKLYLNFNARAKELWEADQAAAIERGHANWPKVLSSNQND